MPRTLRAGQRAQLFVIDVTSGERRLVHREFMGEKRILNQDKDDFLRKVLLLAEKYVVEVTYY